MVSQSTTTSSEFNEIPMASLWYFLIIFLQPISPSKSRISVKYFLGKITGFACSSKYKGKIISTKQSANDPKFDNSKAIYLFNLNKRYDLDGDFRFNVARLINHSCDPNCEVLGEGLKVWVYAMKNINKGDELSYDYGFSYD